MNSEAFWDAVKAGEADEVEQMLRAEPNWGKMRDTSGATPVMVAVYYGHPDLGRRIGEIRGEVDIFEVACLGDENLIANLIAAHPDQVNRFSADGFTPLGFTAYFGHLGCARRLLEAGAHLNVLSQNALGIAPLHSALSGGHTELVQLLMDEGADLNLASKSGWTALHYCADIGDAELAVEIARRGGDRQARDEHDRTPAELAIHVGHDHVAEALAQL